MLSDVAEERLEEVAEHGEAVFVVFLDRVFVFPKLAEVRHCLDPCLVERVKKVVAEFFFVGVDIERCRIKSVEMFKRCVDRLSCEGGEAVFEW